MLQHNRCRSFAFVSHLLCSYIVVHFQKLDLAAIPSDMVSAPQPDFEDPDQVRRYNQDRRVIGVRVPFYQKGNSLMFWHHKYEPLAQPALLRHEIPSTARSQSTVAKARFAAANIIAGQDPRVLVIVGPCSIHSAEEAIEYAHLLKAKIPIWDNLLVVMRSYL